MSSKPYPNYPPSFTIVEETGGLKRTCLVVELLSLGRLTDVQMAMVLERIEASIQALKIPILEKVKVVQPDSFDTLLSAGLRLSHQQQ